MRNTTKNMSSDSPRSSMERRMREEEVLFNKDGEPIVTKNLIQLESMSENNPMLTNVNRQQNVKSMNLTAPIPDFTYLNNLFTSYSTKKTFATGLLDLALIANNFSQMKQIIMAKRFSTWQVLDIVIMFSICASLILQFICGVMIIFSTKQEEFLDDSKRPNLVKKNNVLTLLIVVICFINIFVNVFLNI